MDIGDKPTVARGDSGLELECSRRRRMCHKSASFKIFVVIPKEGGGRGSTKPSFGNDTDFRCVICSLHRMYCIVGVIPQEGLTGPSIRYDNDKDLKKRVFAAHSSSVERTMLPVETVVWSLNAL